MTAAFEWAARSERWVAAGELAAGGYAAYLFDGGSLEARALLERAIAATEGRDPELADHLRVALAHTLVWLNDWSTIGRIGSVLTTSPIPPLRSLGHTVLALVSGFSDVDTAQEQLLRGEAEINMARISDPGLNTEIAAGYIPWIRARIAAQAGDYAAALRDTELYLAVQRSIDYFTTGATRAVKHAGACQILLGDPQVALETVAWLDQFDVPSSNTGDIRALANLALGNVVEAEEDIRSHAARAITGRLTGEACDTVLLLAELAHVEGEDHIARDLLLHMGMRLEPAIVTYSLRLAAQLDIAAAHSEQQLLFQSYSATSAEGPSGSRMAIATVRSELTRRGWPHSPLA